MRLTTLRENLALLNELQEAASNVRYCLCELSDATMIMTQMFETQVKNFVDDITTEILRQFNSNNKG